MRFKSDKQRKAMFANLNKFAKPISVSGYTGSVLVVDEEGKDSPFVVESGGKIPEDIYPVKDTVILAGVGYKGLKDKENIEKRIEDERYRGVPVYSTIPPEYELNDPNLQSYQIEVAKRKSRDGGSGLGLSLEHGLTAASYYSRGNKFATRNDELWNMVMATRDKRIQATPADVERYSLIFRGDPGMQIQAAKDLRLLPMHDAIATWLDSADYVTDPTYEKIESAARLYLSEVNP